MTALAYATPSEDLAQARRAFREGQFSVALEKYNALLYPELKLASTDDLVDAYIGLGVCRLETGDSTGAKREFEKALELDPSHQLDPLIITNKQAIELWDDTKADIRTRKDREAAKNREAEEKERIRKLRASLIGVQNNTRALTLVPGFGQFQNGQRTKGIFFLGAFAISGGLSIGTWGYLVNKYGIRSDKVPPLEAERVRRLQEIEVGSGIIFIATWIWSTIDANRHYKKQVRTEIDESLLPPELREAPPPPKPKTKKDPPKKTSFHIVPMLSPDSAGIGIGWEN
jgi:tetratricopeptide (TPR) repeat protein